MPQWRNQFWVRAAEGWGGGGGMIFVLAFCPLLKPVGMYVAYACRAQNVQAELSRLLYNIYLLVHL